MEERDNLLKDTNEEDDLEDVEMLDVEGEFVDHSSVIDEGQSSCLDGNAANQDSQSKKRRCRTNKKKNKKRKSGSGPNVTDINRFVLDACRLLKEKKSYMVYTAVGCLGVSALNDFLKEVDAIQACGGQMTADGKRHRTGGGILWSIIKAREPNVYKEIMKKSKEFEKQFRQPNVREVPQQKKRGSTPEDAHTSTDGNLVGSSEGSLLVPQSQNQNEQTKSQGYSVFVHDRLRIPVSYADLIGEDSKEDVV